MLKPIKSNNSPGHTHNGLTSVVGLSTNFCPGNNLTKSNKMNKFKILSHKLFDFYTHYKIEYKNVVYNCNFNGGYPKLGNTIGGSYYSITLTESDSYDLSEVIENYFSNVICKETK